MTEDAAKAARDAVVESLSRHQMEEGQRLFAEYSDHLPEAIRLECLGSIHFYRRELQEAVRCYEAAILLAPEKIIARYQYLVGTQEERSGNFVEAFKRYQAAIEAEPTFVDPYVELGGLLVKVDDLEGAAQCYRDAVRIDPSDTANHFNLKVVLGRLSLIDPTRYKSELAAVEVAYEEAAQRDGPKMLGERHW